MGGGSAFVAMNILLKDAEFPSKLSLRPISPDLGDALGKFFLDSFDGACRHEILSSLDAGVNLADTGLPRVTQSKQGMPDIQPRRPRR